MMIDGQRPGEPHCLAACPAVAACCVLCARCRLLFTPTLVLLTPASINRSPVGVLSPCLRSRRWHHAAAGRLHRAPDRAGQPKEQPAAAARHGGRCGGGGANEGRVATVGSLGRGSDSRRVGCTMPDPWSAPPALQPPRAALGGASSGAPPAAADRRPRTACLPADAHGEVKYNCWEKPTEVAKWKEEHIVFVVSAVCSARWGQARPLPRLLPIPQPLQHRLLQRSPRCFRARGSATCGAAG